MTPKLPSAILMDIPYKPSDRYNNRIDGLIVQCSLDPMKSNLGKLRSAVYISNTSFLLASLITVYSAIEGKIHLLTLTQYSTAINYIFGFIAVASLMLIFLNWISMIQNSLKINNGNLLTKKTKIIFGAYLVPNFIITVICLGMVFHQDFLPDSPNNDSFEKATKVYDYFLLASTVIIVGVLWIYLIWQFKKMNDNTRKRTRKFFITAFSFSFTCLTIPIFMFILESEFRGVFNGWFSFSIQMIYELELVFIVYPLNHHKIIKFFNPNYTLPPDTYSGGTTASSKSNGSLSPPIKGTSFASSKDTINIQP
ncbi:hypothetical protein CYY_001898 [Polysphondylium violaceum]|uniref:Uncharacterized protein n=1 Tax=Polysphondylium violaceum TaxID=133409 RepID=A0A8J4V7E8_9MYCE|nr:hypothetical protein CYY_001898 [Polysphondylium violaceum]